MAKIYNFHEGRKDALASSGGVVGKVTPNYTGTTLNSVSVTSVIGTLTSALTTEMTNDYTTFWNTTQVSKAKWTL